MINLYFGILTVILCAGGYCFSWRYHSRGNYRAALILLILCGLALRVYTSTDLYLHPWDERYHALVAKNLVAHPLVPTLYDKPVLPYTLESWTASHIWLHKPPLPLWTMAASLRIFGVNEVSLRLPSIFLTTLGIWLTFSIGSYLIGKKAGYLAALFYSLNGLMIELAAGRVATDHIDVFFLFFVELAVFFTVRYIQKRQALFNILAGISLGAAILSKWLPALIVLPLWLLLVADAKVFRPRTIILQFLLLAGITCAVFVPWQLYIHHVFPLEARWEAEFNYRHITQILEHHERSLLYFFEVIRINYGELIYLPLLWFLWKTITDKKNLKRWALCTWFLIPVIFFTFVQTKMQGYILFTAPALFFMTAEFWVRLSEYRGHPKWRWAFILVLVLLIALPARYALERTKPFEIRERNPQWARDLRALDALDIQRGVLFNYNRPVEAMFYTDLTAYSILPDSATIAEVVRRNYQVFIEDAGSVSPGIRSIPGVKMVRLSEDGKN